VASEGLSAATHELKRSGGRALTDRFRGVLEHYGLRSTRIRPGEAHENGVAERANDLVKRELAQALLLRGSREFDDLEHYRAFAEEVIARRRNRLRAGKLAEERQHLRCRRAAAGRQEGSPARRHARGAAPAREGLPRPVKRLGEGSLVQLRRCKGRCCRPASTTSSTLARRGDRRPRLDPHHAALRLPEGAGEPGWN
jgi:hypothetical protein